MNTATRVQLLEKAVCIYHSAKTSWKSMYLSSLELLVNCWCGPKVGTTEGKHGTRVRGKKDILTKVTKYPILEVVLLVLLLIHTGVTVLLLVILFTNPSARAGYDTRSIFKRSLTSFNSEFSFSLNSCLTKAEEPSLSYYLPIAGGRIIGFIPFPRVLVLCEMQSVSSRIWNRVAVFISYDDNNYTPGTSVI